MSPRTAKWQGQNWVRPSTRLALYLRDGLACVYCGAGVEDGAQLTLDHITPFSKGGTHRPENLVTCCHRCNCSRGNRSVASFAKAVAGYVRQSPALVVAHVRRTVRRDLPRREALDLLARRGTIAKVLKAKRVA